MKTVKIEKLVEMHDDLIKAAYTDDGMSEKPCDHKKILAVIQDIERILNA